MKIRTFLLVTGLILALSELKPANAQSYWFHFDQIPYSEISGNFLSLNEAFDDTLYKDIPIGFQFRFAGRSWTRLHIHSDGQILFGDDPEQFDTLKAIIPFGTDLYGDYFNHTPAISYESGGCAGAVVMKIQFKECSLKGGGPNDFISFQVWLYESSGTIEFHYGNGMASSSPACFGGNSGPRSGIRISVPENNDVIYSLLLTSFAFGPDTSMSPLPSYLEGIPEENMVYIFEPLNTTGILADAIHPDGITIFYDQGMQRIQLTSVPGVNGNFRFQLSDVSGRVFMARDDVNNLNGNHEYSIPVQMLPPGSYYLNVGSANNRRIFRFIKL